MRRSREIVGKTIVSAADGKKLGSVTDLLVDGRRHCLVGLVVRAGLFAAERVLPYQDIHTVGTDAVIAKSADGLLDRRGWRERAIPTMRSSHLKGRRVVTATGRNIGAVSDVLIDEQSGNVEGYEIAGTGLGLRRSMLPRAGDVRVGPDVIVIPDDAAPEASPPRAKLASN